jgi:hypothetical protein
MPTSGSWQLRLLELLAVVIYETAPTLWTFDDAVHTNTEFDVWFGSRLLIEPPDEEDDEGISSTSARAYVWRIMDSDAVGLL